MRKQIAASNWKMNLNLQKADELLQTVLTTVPKLKAHQQVIIAVPFPFLQMAKEKIATNSNFEIAAQNCHHKKSGAFTGEISTEMLQSICVNYCIVGHSERREYFLETNNQIAEKINLCLADQLAPIFCCGENLSVRDSENQNNFVKVQLSESLFHLSEDEIKKIIIAYEPIWAIGTGKTATANQVQQMHAHIRTVIAEKYGEVVANEISILYGGSVNAANAKEIFNCQDVDGGLVGGASLKAVDFVEIISGLK